MGMPGTLVLGRPSLSVAVERQVMQQTNRNARAARASAPAQKGLSARQQQIAAALDKVRLKEEDPHLQDHVLSWKDFERHARENALRATQELDEWNSLAQEMRDLLEFHAEGLEKFHVNTIEQERPSYGKETKGVPYIYLTDASGHGTQSVAEEVALVLRSVRQANPQAHILFATEFAVMENLRTPIRFVGKDNPDMGTVDPYDKLLSQADKLQIDVLALDDSMIWQWNEKTIGYKIGEWFLSYPSDTPLEKLSEQQLDKMIGTVDASTQGVLLRNKQWTQYLRAVKPFYDIVVVYAGNGHLNSADLPAWDVPIQMAEKYVLFDFYTVEENDAENAFGDKTYEWLCETNTCVKIPSQPQEEEAADIVWDGQSVFYEKFDTRIFKKYVASLPPNRRARFTQLVEKLRQAGFKNVEPEVRFSVYLPDVTQK